MGEKEMNIVSEKHYCHICKKSNPTIGYIYYLFCSKKCLYEFRNASINENSTPLSQEKN